MFDDRLLKILDEEVAKEKAKKKKKVKLELRKEKRLQYYSGWSRKDKAVDEEGKTERQTRLKNS